MGVAHYCWSVVVLLIEMMSRQWGAGDMHRMIQPTVWLVVRTAANSSRQWCTVRRSNYSSRFEEWEEWMSVGLTTWFDESRDAVDQLELETGCWRLCRMLLSDYFFGKLTEVTIQADWEDWWLRWCAVVVLYKRAARCWTRWSWCMSLAKCGSHAADENSKRGLTTVVYCRYDDMVAGCKQSKCNQDVRWTSKRCH